MTYITWVWSACQIQCSLVSVPNTPINITYICMVDNYLQRQYVRGVICKWYNGNGKLIYDNDTVLCNVSRWGDGGVYVWCKLTSGGGVETTSMNMLMSLVSMSILLLNYIVIVICNISREEGWVHVVSVHKLEIRKHVLSITYQYIDISTYMVVFWEPHQTPICWYS